MKRGTFTMNSHDGKTKLHGVTWEPEGEARAVVQIVHGMIEYIERYDGFASYLAERGYFVIGHDHLGHGESAASQDDWGFFEEENGNRVLLEDIHQVRRRAQERYPGRALYPAGTQHGFFPGAPSICASRARASVRRSFWEPATCPRLCCGLACLSPAPWRQ